MTASARLHTLAKATLWDRAYLALKSALLEGRYAPGDRIVLRDVAEELGISLTPVRDAVNRLSAEKVLHRGSAGNGGGATVPLLTTDQFRQLMTVRSSLEPVAVAAAARLATRWTRIGWVRHTRAYSADRQAVPRTTTIHAQSGGRGSCGPRQRWTNG